MDIIVLDLITKKNFFIKRLYLEYKLECKNTKQYIINDYEICRYIKAEYYLHKKKLYFYNLQ